MLKFVPDYLKTKIICKHAIKKLPYLLRYVPDQCKTKQMWDKAILQNVEHWTQFLTATKINKCLIKWFMITFVH